MATTTVDSVEVRSFWDWNSKVSEGCGDFLIFVNVLSVRCHTFLTISVTTAGTYARSQVLLSDTPLVCPHSGRLWSSTQDPYRYRSTLLRSGPSRTRHGTHWTVWTLLGVVRVRGTLHRGRRSSGTVGECLPHRSGSSSSNMCVVDVTNVGTSSLVLPPGVPGPSPSRKRGHERDRCPVERSYTLPGGVGRCSRRAREPRGPRPEGEVGPT